MNLYVIGTILRWMRVYLENGSPKIEFDLLYGMVDNSTLTVK